MKKMILVLLAFSPFAIGFFLNFIYSNYNLNGFVFLWISILFLGFWFLLGYWSSGFIKSAVQSVWIGNSLTIFTLVLIVFQEIILGRYFYNILGIASQLFYLPVLKFIYETEEFIYFLNSVHAMWMSYVLAAAFMIVVYYMGYSVRKKSF
ncbi:MAG: hypothetical protein AAGU75_15825 [Bacillota bacterium]